MLQKLQKVGDTFVLNMPKAFIDQHQLGAGQQVDLQLLGTNMTIKVPARKPTQLADLVAGMNEQMAM